MSSASGSGEDPSRPMAHQESAVIRPATEAEQVAFLMTKTATVPEEMVEEMVLDISPRHNGAAPGSVPRIPQGMPPAEVIEVDDSIETGAQGDSQTSPSGYVNANPTAPPLASLPSSHANSDMNLNQSMHDLDMNHDAGNSIRGNANQNDSSEPDLGRVTGIPREVDERIDDGFDGTKTKKHEVSQLFRRSSTYAPELTECPICFEDLCTEPLAVMLAGRPPAPSSSPNQNASCQRQPPRSCRHFLHASCLADIRLDPRKWFTQISMTGGGDALSKREIIDALSAVLPVDNELLAQTVHEKWSEWTQTPESMTLEEFVEPRRGMLQWVLYNLPDLGNRLGASGSDMPSSQGKHIPDLMENKESWFRFWDVDRAHALTFNQLVRGLVKTFRLEGNVDAMLALRGSLEELWSDFGLQKRGNVSLALFVEKDSGFMDTLAAQWRGKIGADQFNRLLRQSRIYEMPVSDLKRALLKLGKNPTAAVEKNELVHMLLEAEEEEEERKNRKEAQGGKRSRDQFGGEDPNTQKLRDSFSGLSVSELKRRLHAKGVKCDHCVMKDELVDLLMMYTNNPAYAKKMNFAQASASSSTRQATASNTSYSYTGNNIRGNTASVPRQTNYVPSNTYTNAQGVSMRRVVCGACQAAQDIPSNTDMFQCYRCGQTLKITVENTATNSRGFRKKKKGDCCCM
jgi:hypothetical protein